MLLYFDDDDDDNYDDDDVEADFFCLYFTSCIYLVEY